MNHLPYRAIALDLDGTLTNHDKVVTPKTREALLQAEAEGVVIILASGRPTYGIEPVAECLELDKRGGYILSYNGGYIGRVRPDGKIDVTLQKTGIQQTADFAETLYQYLLDNDGECNLGDKSEADDIYERFHVSKKVYKRAVGDLYKKRLITVSPMSIRLAE